LEFGVRGCVIGIAAVEINDDLEPDSVLSLVDKPSDESQYRKRKTFATATLTEGFLA
jgi:hypothetical protein